MAISDGNLNEMKEIECMGNISGTLNVKVMLKSGSREEFEFYTGAGQLRFNFSHLHSKE